MKVNKHTIEAQIRQGLSKGWTDEMIGKEIGVATSTITTYRAKLKIPPADKFERKFRETYGTDALERFDALVQRRATLHEIAQAFGFSREYARQVRAKLYQRPCASSNTRQARATAPYPDVPQAS